jgi:hypothetical protein
VLPARQYTRPGWAALALVLLVLPVVLVPPVLPPVLLVLLPLCSMPEAVR